jgi:hypothetical protein
MLTFSCILVVHQNLYLLITMPYNKPTTTAPHFVNFRYLTKCISARDENSGPCRGFHGHNGLASAVGLGLLVIPGPRHRLGQIRHSNIFKMISSITSIAFMNLHGIECLWTGLHHLHWIRRTPVQLLEADEAVAVYVDHIHHVLP